MTDSLHQPPSSVSSTPLWPEASFLRYKKEDDGNAINEDPNEKQYANRHIPRFLSFESDANSSSSVLQVVTDGSLLTASALEQDKNAPLNLSKPILVVDAPTSIGMKVPKGKGKEKNFSVRDVANVVGMQYPIAVIDVMHQEELEGWTMEDLVDYFEDEDRLRQLRMGKEESSTQQSEQDLSSPKRPRRRAAAAAVLQQEQRPKVLNQISMEFSRTPLHRLVNSPKFVRDMDWIDHVWPASLKKKGDYPVVQFYCLTSTAGCYTDFHIDFGGTSVWYHVLNGAKEFILIPPSKQNLESYEDWLCRPNQAELFLPDLLSSLEGCVKVTLKASQTMIIPTGWIHAVHTPVDSVVVGGNFLHGLDMSLQLLVHCLETRSRVKERFRFPYFVPIMYYAGGYYLRKARHGNLCQKEVDGLKDLIPALNGWLPTTKQQQRSGTGITIASAAHDAASRSNCSSVEEMLLALQSEYDRLKRCGICANPSWTAPSKATIKAPIKLKLKPPSPNRNMIEEGGTSKPKLRLKLSPLYTGGFSPARSSSHEEDKNESRSDDDVDSDADSSEFRIVIPQSSMYVLPPKTKKRKMATYSAKEDADVLGRGTAMARDDGEWRPPRKRATPQKHALPPQPVVSLSPEAKHAMMKGRKTKGVVVSKKSKSTTARQRLMKRIR